MTRAATTVEAATTAADRASTVKAIAASAMETVAAVEFITSADYTTGPFVATKSAMTPITAPIIPMSIVTAAVIRTTVEPMEPGAGADEYSVREVIRAPISVRRASVRSIRVVAVSAYRRRSDRYSHRTNSDPYSHSYLRARNSAHREH